MKLNRLKKIKNMKKIVKRTLRRWLILTCVFAYLITSFTYWDFLWVEKIPTDSELRTGIATIALVIAGVYVTVLLMLWGAEDDDNNNREAKN